MFFGVLALVLLLGALWRWSPLNQWLNIENLLAAADYIRSSPLTIPIVLGIYLLGSCVMFPVNLLILATATSAAAGRRPRRKRPRRLRPPMPPMPGSPRRHRPTQQPKRSRRARRSCSTSRRTSSKGSEARCPGGLPSAPTCHAMVVGSATAVPTRRCRCRRCRRPSSAVRFRARAGAS